MTQPANHSEPSEADDRGGLLFAWMERGTNVAVHFGVFVAISVVVHLFGFYLFQVVYPVTGRVEPEPSRAYLLDPAQPAVAALMRQIDDRLVYLQPASSGSDVRVDLNDHSMQFRPSFFGRTVEFLPIPVPEAAASTPRPAP